ncbi:FecR family protein [Chitinophaga sp. RAB17]|uniref:FecR family protein n=1 Tax=Chitinophaga sp. RAB17 TaxID=3233049 RepID=UPI003F9084FF
MLNYRYIRFLLQKQLQEGLSEEEELFLQQWYQSLETMPAEMPSTEEQAVLKQHSWQQLSAIYGQSATPPPAAIIKHIPRWQRFAWPAAAAVLLLIGLKFLSPEQPAPKPVAWVSLQCPPGKRLKMVLPDSSVVWLNSGSSLQYNPDFVQQRQFNVRNGEVFFEVAKDAAHPFIVKTKSLAVKVLGTSFNVAAYTKLTQEKVTVASGNVQVLDEHQCNVILGAGQEIVYNSSKASFSTQLVNAARSNSWRNGDIYLTNVSLEELAVKLENIYGYEVVFTNNKMKQCINSLHFNDKEPVTKVLDLLKIIDKITYTINNGKIIISGKPC